MIKMEPVTVNIVVNDPVCAKFMDRVSANILFFCKKCAFCLRTLPGLAHHVQHCEKNPIDIDNTLDEVISLVNKKNEDNRVNDLYSSREITDLGKSKECGDCVEDDTVDASIDPTIVLDMEDAGLIHECPKHSMEINSEITADFLPSIVKEETHDGETDRDLGKACQLKKQNDSNCNEVLDIDHFIDKYMEFVAHNVDVLYQRSERHESSLREETNSKDISKLVVNVANGFDFSQDIKSTFHISGLESSTARCEAWQCTDCPNLNLLNDIDLSYHLQCHDRNESTKFKCVLCNNRSSAADNTVKDWSTMRSHLSSVHGIDFKIRCDQCIKTFPSILKLNAHRNNIHKLVCEVSNQMCKYSSFDTREMEIHEKCHDPENVMIFRCPECGSSAAKARNAFKQILQHIEEKHQHLLSQRFMCPGCDEGFHSEIKYKEHYCYGCKSIQHVYHQCMFCSSERRIPVAGLRDHIAKDRQASLFKSKAMKAIQMLKDGRNMGDIYTKLCCNLMNKPDNLDAKAYDEIDTSTGVLFKCKLCYKKLKTKNSFERHMFRCHPEGNDEAVCPLCGKLFRTKNQYRTHHQQVHAGQKRKHTYGPHTSTENQKSRRIIKCTHCDYTSPHKTRMRNHNMSVHMGIYPYKCKQCDYASNESSDLRRHEKKHLGLKRFPCSKCNYKASHHWLLVTHCKGQHGIDIPKKRDAFNFMGTQGSMRWQRKREKERESRKKTEVNEQASVHTGCSSNSQQVSSTMKERDLRTDVKEETTNMALLQNSLNQESLGKLLQSANVETVESNEILQLINHKDTNLPVQDNIRYIVNGNRTVSGFQVAGNVYNTNLQNIGQQTIGGQSGQTVFLYIDQ